jgi:hypothetical protein
VDLSFSENHIIRAFEPVVQVLIRVVAWTWLLGPILIVSEADRLAQEGLTARWESHVDAWDRRLIIFLVYTYIYIVVARPNVCLSDVWLSIRESLSSTAETEVSATCHSCLVAFCLEISQERVS